MRPIFFDTNTHRVQTTDCIVRRKKFMLNREPETTNYDAIRIINMRESKRQEDANVLCSQLS